MALGVLMLLLLLVVLMTVAAAERVLGRGWSQTLGGRVGGVGLVLELRRILYSSLDFKAETLRLLLLFVVFLVVLLVRAVMMVVLAVTMVFQRCVRK